MSEHIIKLPDVGEGVAEAELVELHVKIGDLVREDAVIAAVMTDKATVEIPSPVTGEVTWLGAEVGQTIAVGSAIVKIAAGADGSAQPRDRNSAETDSKEDARAASESTQRPSPPPGPSQPTSRAEAEPRSAASNGKVSARGHGAMRPEGEKPLASPAVRQRAREAGVDLRQVSGTGPAGRIGHKDLDTFIAGEFQQESRSTYQRRDGVDEVKIVGLRRRIAEKMVRSVSSIPHITYVEEIDVTALEDLRARLNADTQRKRPKLTLLPFLMRSIVKAISEQPQLNAIFDDTAGILHRHAGVHIGIAAQTPNGLMVPVVHHTEALDLWECAAEAARLAEAARAGTALREELTGSTITISSLGALGGIVTTPVINHPEVAIVGVNKIAMRPVWDGDRFVPRKMMNLSSSFDHRVIDGWDAAVFVQRLKALLEAPALIFVEE